MKRRGAELVQQHIAGMTPEQELDYWRQQTEDLYREQQQILQTRKNLDQRRASRAV
jgi:hypothetical protein